MLMLVNGDYVPQAGGLRTAEGDAALLQRILLKLTARRGQFPFMEEFGSRLWMLGRLKEAERQAAAEQYAAEALADEPGVSVESVTLTPGLQGEMGVKVFLLSAGTRLTAELALK